MKKKRFLTFGIIIIAIVVLNVITYIYGKNPMYNYVKSRYFPDILNLDEQFGIKDYKIGEQKIEINGYTMIMDQYYFKEDMTTGCLRIKVTNHDYDMRELTTRGNYDENTFDFGEENIRYFFSGDVDGESIKNGVKSATAFEHFRTIRTKDAMYIYFEFGSDDGILFNGKIYLHDRTAQKGLKYSEYAGKKKYAIGTFDMLK